jgi:PAS domain-containing protein
MHDEQGRCRRAPEPGGCLDAALWLRLRLSGQLSVLRRIPICRLRRHAATEAILAPRAADPSYAPRIEKRYRRRDGGIIKVELSTFMVPIMGGAPLHAAVAVDITERKRAETALRRSEAYLTEGQRLSHSGSFGWHVARGDIFWSTESFNIFGYDQAPTANIDLVLQRVHPEDLALVQRVIADASSGHDFDFEHRLLMQDGGGFDRP